MSECSRYGADDFESESFPKMNCRSVRRDNKIKLHGAKPESTSLNQTMLGHCPPYSFPLCVRRDDEGSVGNMRPATRLVRLQKITADQFSFMFGNEGVTVIGKPVAQGIATGHGGIKGVGLPRGSNLMQHLP